MFSSKYSILVLFVTLLQFLSTYAIVKIQRFPCENNSECENLNGTKVVCVGEFCQCDGNMHCSEKIVSLTVVTRIGEKCKLNQECNIQHSECKDLKCVCSNGTVASTDAKQCLLMSSGLGGNCEDSVQCYSKVNNSGCYANKCVCQQGMHDFNETCHKNVALEESCNSTAECSITEFSHCVNQTCKCKAKYIHSPSTNKCLLTAEKYGSPCVDDIQCKKLLGGASGCRGGFCKCHDLYQLKSGTNKCVRDMLLGDTCKNHNECHGPEEGESRLECILNICKCQPFYYEEDGYCVSSSCRPELTQFILILILMLSFTLFY